MNELINEGAVLGLAEHLEQAGGGQLASVRASAVGLDDLSLRERSDRVSAAIIGDLGDYNTVQRVVRGALRSPTLRGWTMWPVGEAVTTTALVDGGVFEDALALQAELTPRLTSEFAIRRLLAADLDRALKVVGTWTSSPDEHVRRLASEGTRSYLPWAIRVPALLARPDATIPILDSLYRDESETVRRSVANHLNDLARTHPELVVVTARRWLDEPDENTARLVRHALRTLIKKGHPGALELLGYGSVSVAVSRPTLDTPVVHLPGHLRFDVEVTNTASTPATLAIDYAIHFVKSTGALSDKVFKLASVTLAPGETARLSKGHTFRQMTTRVHYSGTHALEIQVNGERHGTVVFEIVA
jgi:3-methyladenine DNA glycosylase AlkC